MGSDAAYAINDKRGTQRLGSVFTAWNINAENNALKHSDKGNGARRARDAESVEKIWKDVELWENVE